MALALCSATISMVSTPLTYINGPEVAKTLPGVTAPFGFFDPMGLTPDTQEELMLYREAELAHGRVAMMATVGFLTQEAFHPIFAAPQVDGPVIRQLDQVLEFPDGQSAASVLLLAIFISEIGRAQVGWMNPSDAIRTLRPGYVPGDVGFDPMGLKPKDEAGLKEMQTKEINNGRLAMLAVAGMTVQELVTGTTLF